VSLALLLTVVSNVLGIFTMPFIVPHVVAASALGAAGSSSSTAGMLDPVALMLQLCQTILLPTFIGASIRGVVPGGWLLLLDCCQCAYGVLLHGNIAQSIALPSWLGATASDVNALLKALPRGACAGYGYC
jgi:hypothetical protein